MCETEIIVDTLRKDRLHQQETSLLKSGVRKNGVQCRKCYQAKSLTNWSEICDGLLSRVPREHNTRRKSVQVSELMPRYAGEFVVKTLRQTIGVGVVDGCIFINDRVWIQIIL